MALALFAKLLHLVTINFRN